MAKLTKRLLIIAMAVVLVAGLGIAGFVMASEPEAVPVCFKQGDVSPDGTVTAADAIYLLYASFPMFKDEYPLNQDCDFEKDGVVDRMDAIYLLYASNDLTAADYPLKEMVHSYHTPVWSWDETAQTATVTFKCGCGQELTLGAQDGVAVSSAVTKAATCTAAGTTTLTAKVQFEGQEYTATKELTVSPTGVHNLNAVPDCVTNAQCADCDYKWVAPGHNMVLTRTVEATCTAAGEEFYACQNEGCNHTQKVELEQLPHTLRYMENGDHTVPGETCVYVKRYTCANPGCTYAGDGTAASDTYVKHDYSIVDIVEATCVKEGTKTYKCACGAVNENVETISVNENHDWGTDGKCRNAGCSAAKVVATDNKVTANALTADTSLELKDKSGNAVALTMDEAALNTVAGGENANRELKISIDQVAVEDLQLDESVQGKEDQIRGTVYDFTMVYADNELDKVSNFGGKVTVSVPYTLANDESADDIDVWYIDDNGMLQSVEGTYCNGYVTFSVEHFSYYTVTKLTPAERCQRYGHMSVRTQKAATCTEDGYDMTACQRCGQVTEKQIIQAEGHTFGEAQIKAATCTANGTKTVACQKSGCGHTVITVIPATGHNMKQDETAGKAATCTAEGKLVKTCRNEGCNHTTEEAIAQLTHDHQYSQEGSQAATCTAGGFDLYVCSREGCNDQIKKNETTPLGHSYSEANAHWTWTEDEFGNWKAKVTLTCGNNCGQTQELDAVVSHNEDASQNASCLGSGASVYNGTVFYNNVTYTAVKEVTQVAPGHQPGTAWEFNDARHYRICKVCQEMVDPTAHVWGEAKVTKEATCVDKGEQSVACSVCGFSKTSEIPATGIHDIVNGKCDTCGFEESTCNHLRMYGTAVDMSQYDICPGLEVTRFSCDCGEEQHMEVVGEPRCDFGDYEDMVHENYKDQYGFEVNKRTGNCAKCGLQMIYTSYSDFDPETCTRVYLSRYEYVLDGELIGVQEHAMHEMSHPGVTVTKTEELTKETHGMCGETITYKVCPCGKYESVEVAYEQEGEGTANTCRWVYSYDFETDTGRYVCMGCNTVRTQEYGEAESTEPCLQLETYTYTYTRNGQQIHTATGMTGYYGHDYKLVDYEKMGELCSDGIQIQMKCAECNDVYDDFITDHMTVRDQVIDLSGKNICFDQMVQSTCLCEEAYKNYYLKNTGDKYCDWQYQYDNYGNMIKAVCSVCEASFTRENSFSDKDANCNCRRTTATTYTDKDGNQIAVGYDIDDVEAHNVKENVKLTEGAQSCEDGVIVMEYCTDCDYEDSYTYTRHYNYDLQVYDLSAFNSCLTDVTLQGCACGYEMYANYNGQGCHWQYVGGGENTSIEKCMNCGIVRKETYSAFTTDDPCLVRDVWMVELSKEGVTPVKFSFDQLCWNHDEIFELTLLPGATSCTGGYMAKEICQRCGFTAERGPMYGHNYYPVSSEIVCEDALCSPVVKKTVTCACGKDSWERYEWQGEECRYTGGYYSEEYKGYVYVCEGCGGQRIDTYLRENIPGKTCAYLQREIDYYLDKDGNELFVRENEYEQENHDYIYTFRMMGQTCQEGYYADGVCSKCGNVQTGEYLQTDCGSYTIANHVLADLEGACGPISIEVQSCPCGKKLYGAWSYDCDFTWGANDAGTCRSCGLVMERDGTTTYIPGDCLVNVTWNTSISLGDQGPVKATANYQTRSHEWVTTFTKYGPTCEDGWTKTQTCVYCGDVERWGDTRYDHMNHVVQYQDLYALGLCGGSISHTSCACGKNHDIDIEFACDWQNTGNKDAEGLDESICTKCGATRYYGESGQLDEATCKYEGIERIKVIKDGTLVLDESLPYVNYRHNMQVTGGALVPGATSCEQGVDLYFTCKNCGETSTGTNHYHHQFYVRTIDLSQMGSDCGTTIELSSCICGKISSYDYDNNCSMSVVSKGDNKGLTGNSEEINTCSRCKAVITFRRDWTVDENTCQSVENGTVTVQVGNINDSFQFKSESTRHDWGEEVHTLNPGATSCEQGYTSTQTCKRCGDQAVGGGTGHSSARVGRLDLTAYGSACGGFLDHYACACGKYERYSLPEDNACKVEQKDIELWFEEEIPYGTRQLGTDGWEYYYGYAYSFICPVTDPACSLKLRMAEYWDLEGCVATEMQTWQYFDAATNDWVEIDTVKTGSVRAYHNYTKTDLSETRADGSKVTGTRYDCACGSYAIDETVVFAQGTEREELNAVNTNTAVARATYKRVYEYDLIHKGNKYLTKSTTEYTNHNGTGGWQIYEYRYDLTGECKCTVYETGPNGYKYHYDTDVHRNTYYSKVTKAATCTQYGEEAWGYTCGVCGKEDSRYTQKISPIAHDWRWSEDADTYVCDKCGLESANGASGDIVLEDLSEAYGSGEDYVIGYWNRNGGEFMVRASVILYDLPEGSNEMYLEGIDFLDVEVEGVSAKYTNMPLLRQTALETVEMNGYEGSYGIRVSFVPLDGTSDQDCAITFDVQ